MKVTLRKHGINIVLGLCTTGKVNIIFVPMVCLTQLFPKLILFGHIYNLASFYGFQMSNFVLGMPPTPTVACHISVKKNSAATWCHLCFTL